MVHSAGPTRRLVLVTGPGRSGTSTVTGSLKRLGLHVPQPEVPADETNPRGFYEPQWVVDFHKSLLNPIPVRAMDARPQARDLVAARASAPHWTAEVEEFLRAQDDHQQVLVKDPRAVWTTDLWQRAAERTGRSTVHLSMMRHPVEVVRSRDSHYLDERKDAFRKVRAVANVAAWCNLCFETERSTRGARRVFVQYDDLLADWRSTLSGVQQSLGLDYDVDLATGVPHAVDDFIDVKLNRSRDSWDSIEVPEVLHELASRVWELMCRLVVDPADVGVGEELDELRARYARLHELAEAVALDHTSVQVELGRRQLRRKLTGGPEQ